MSLITDLPAFVSLFTGNEEFYVENIYSPGEAKKGEKLKGQSFYKKEPVTDKLFLAHLRGEKGLGISPIDSEDKCKFAVIDIDVYGGKLKKIVQALYDSMLPIVPVRSKSGGLHIYFMFKKAVSAKSVRRLLLDVVEVFGLDKVFNKSVEIFPKQNTLAGGKKGSCINLPYFAAEKTKQFVIDRELKKVDFATALTIFDKARVTLDAFTDVLDTLEYSDAPCCIQTILLSKALGKDSGRNNFLYTVSIYLKKKFGDDFLGHLEDINESLPYPIEDQELQSIYLSVRDNEYNYKCHDIPCEAFCNKKVCASREFGVGRNKGYFTGLDYGQIYRMMTQDPYYVWELRPMDSDGDFVKVHFEDESKLLDQRHFARVCLRHLNMTPYIVKENTWFETLNANMSKVIEVEVSETTDTSASAEVKSAFFRYLAQKRAHEKYPVQVKMGLTFFKNGKYYFTNEGFERYLAAEKVKVTGLPLREHLIRFGAKEDSLEYQKRNGDVTVLKCWSKEEDGETTEAREYYDDVYSFDEEIIDEAFEETEDENNEEDDNAEEKF